TTDDRYEVSTRWESTRGPGLLWPWRCSPVPRSRVSSGWGAGWAPARGVGLAAAPVTARLEPSLVPALLLWLALVMPVVTLAREHDRIDWPGLWWSLPTRVGVPGIGVVLVATFTAAQLGVAVAVMVLVVVALTIHTIVLPITRASLM